MPNVTSFLSVKTQFENAGDALINRELLRLCSKYSQVTLDIGRCPKEFVESLNLDLYAPDVMRVSTLELFWKMGLSRLNRRETYYFLIPGGYVGEKAGKQALSILLNTLALILMRAIGVRVCHVGVSYERLGKFHAGVLAYRSKLMHHVLVRDKRSQKYAEELGIRVDGVMTDLAFGAASYQAHMATTCDSIAISFRADQAEQQRSDVVAIVDRLDATLPTGTDFRFIAQVERDLPLMNELAGRQYRNGRRAELYDTWMNADAALDAYLGCEFVISNRLHSLLFGLARGCRPIPYVDQQLNQKILGMLEQLGLSVFGRTSFEDSMCVERILGEARYVDVRGIVDAQLHILESAFYNLLAAQAQSDGAMNK